MQARFFWGIKYSNGSIVASALCDHLETSVNIIKHGHNEPSMSLQDARDAEWTPIGIFQAQGFCRPLNRATEFWRFFYLLLRLAAHPAHLCH